MKISGPGKYGESFYRSYLGNYLQLQSVLLPFTIITIIIPMLICKINSRTLPYFSVLVIDSEENIIDLAFHPCSNIIQLLKLFQCIFQIEVVYVWKVKNRIFHQMRGLFQETEKAMNIQVVWKFIFKISAPNNKVLAGRNGNSERIRISSISRVWLLNF